MVSQDFLFYSLGIGFLILVGFVSYAAYNLSLTLKELTSILTKVDDIAQDAEDLKNYIKKGIMSFLNLFVARKGGGKNDKK